MQEENRIPANEVCAYHNIEIGFIYSLQEYGLVEITDDEEALIAADQLSELEKFICLHYELNINLEGIDVIQHLLKKLEATQQEMTSLRNQLKFYRNNS